MKAPRRSPVRRLGVVAFWLCAAGTAGSRHANPDHAGATPPTRAEIWAAIQPAAERYRIDPAFVFTLVAAESNFDPRARNGQPRGLLQLKPGAWRLVSRDPYEPTAWDWRANLAAGIDYLAYLRGDLRRKTTFSYPLLLGAFHYGLDFAENRRFDLRHIPIPDSDIFRQLWAGKFMPMPASTK